MTSDTLSLNEQGNLLLRPATLLGPENLHAEAQRMRQDARAMRGHAFGLSLPNRVIQQLESPNARHGLRLSLYPSPNGVVVMCLTLQVAGTQLRTVADCSDPRVRTWLAWLVARGRAQWFVEVEESRQVAWVHRLLDVSDPGELFKHAAQSAGPDPLHQAMEVACVASALLNPAAIDSLVPDFTVETMVVALVAPADPQGSNTVH